MKRPETPEEESELVNKIFSDLPPFQITIRKHTDAMFLSSACLCWITGGKTDEGRKLLLNIGHYAMQTSVEEAVNFTFDKGEELGHHIPGFVRPLMKLMLQHMFDKKEQLEQEDSDQTDED